MNFKVNYKTIISDTQVGFWSVEDFLDPRYNRLSKDTTKKCNTFVPVDVIYSIEHGLFYSKLIIDRGRPTLVRDRTGMLLRCTFRDIDLAKKADKPIYLCQIIENHAFLYKAAILGYYVGELNNI